MSTKAHLEKKHRRECATCQKEFFLDDLQVDRAIRFCTRKCARQQYRGFLKQMAMGGALDRQAKLSDSALYEAEKKGR